MHRSDDLLRQEADSKLPFVAPAPAIDLVQPRLREYVLASTGDVHDLVLAGEVELYYGHFRVLSIALIRLLCVLELLAAVLSKGVVPKHLDFTRVSEGHRVDQAACNLASEVFSLESLLLHLAYLGRFLLGGTRDLFLLNFSIFLNVSEVLLDEIVFVGSEALVECYS